MNKNSKVILGIVFFLFSTMAIMACTAIKGSNLLFSLALILWLGLIIYVAEDIKRHIVLFCFLISFFVFLIGRELCFAFLNLQRYYRYLEDYNNITFFLMALSLLFLFLGYLLVDKYNISSNNGVLRISKRKENSKAYSNLIERDNERRRLSIRKASQIAYYFCLLFTLIDLIIQIRLVGSVGYLGAFVDTNVSAPTVIGYFSSFTIVALSVYLATCPAKKNSIVALVTYELYGILSMMTGHRYAFVAVSMFFLTYIVYRHNMEGGWISRAIVLTIILSVPFVIFLMNIIEAVRSGHNGSENIGALQSLISFLDQQGGSVNVIKRIFYYKKQISDMILTSFSNTRAVLFENAIVRSIFGINAYSGNSIDNAMHGHFLSHRLSYLEYGDYYFLGHGTGSSYIAELFLDFGFLGVIIGNFIYGVVIRKVTDIGNRHYIRNALLFASQYYIYLAPRGDFDGMIGGLFSLTSILGLIGIWILSFAFMPKGISS